MDRLTNWVTTKTGINNDNRIYSQIIILVVIILVTLSIMVIIKMSFSSILVDKNNKPWILKDSKNAKNSLVIPQNPKEEGAITLYRSHD